MTTFIANSEYVVVLLLLLSVLVVAHEWGHFIVARIFKIRVDDFSIGFGPRLFRIGKLGETEYNVRMLPLGGFVKIAGMEPDEKPLLDVRDAVIGKSANADVDSHELPLIAENISSERSKDDLANGFNSKPIWQRALVILAGPAMSFLFGYFILCIMGFTVGIQDGVHTTTKVAQVEPGGAGYVAGLRTGDQIVSINGVTISTGNQMVDTIQNSLGKQLRIVVERRSNPVVITAIPRRRVDDEGKPLDRITASTVGVLGPSIALSPSDQIIGIGGERVHDAGEFTQFIRTNKFKNVSVIVLRQDEEKVLTGMLPVSPLTGVTMRDLPVGFLKFEPSSKLKFYGVRDSFAFGTRELVQIAAGLHELLVPERLKQSAGGVVRIYQMTSLAVESGASQVMFLAANISISLAIFNLLPIPVLDGGHLLAMAIEKARSGKKFTEREYQAFALTGLAIIGVLFVTINAYNILQTIRHAIPQ